MDSAAIITSLISLLDTSIEYQIKECKDYCKLLSVVVELKFKEFGYIDKHTLETKRWNDLVRSNINILVFYQVKQLSISAEYLYDVFIKNREVPIRMYFVKDHLAFDGCPPLFRTINIDVKFTYRKKIRDLITISNMTTCNDKILQDFINNNFGNVSSLLRIIDSDSIWLRKVIMSGKYKHGSKIRSYRHFMFTIRRIKKKEASSIDDICNNIQSITI
ncbi:Pox F16 superfamily protein [Swinepox virus]|uniref:Protein OPG061 n=1 Tax=Swinepox virus TaxID=10276 RepID=A0A881SY06_SWPV|nr:Pox F16 superfamily protein [Swinepox virus]